MKNAYILKSFDSNKNSENNVDDSLNQINKFSRRKLNQDEVYVFSMILCDNEVDREYEKFSDEALNSLKKLFLGKTGIFDHVPSGANQTARIFFTDVVTSVDKQTSLKTPYKYLLAKAYMVRSEKNKDLILEIDAGIKKEISVGCCVKSKICSICGVDHKLNLCEHIPGQRYVTNNEQKLCFVSLEEPTDAYEWSFVAVPAQVNAGVIKNFHKNSDNNFENKNHDFNNQDAISSTDFAEIKKSLLNLGNKNSSCLLSAQSLKSLTKYISDLELKKLYFDEYVDNLRSEVYKKLLISQPFLKQSSLNNIISHLSYHELKDLNKNLDFGLDFKTENKMIPTQLNPAKQDSLSPENYIENTHNINNYKL